MDTPYQHESIKERTANDIRHAAKVHVTTPNGKVLRGEPHGKKAGEDRKVDTGQDQINVAVRVIGKSPGAVQSLDIEPNQAAVDAPKQDPREQHLTDANPDLERITAAQAAMVVARIRNNEILQDIALVVLVHVTLGIQDDSGVQATKADADAVDHLHDTRHAEHPDLEHYHVTDRPGNHRCQLTRQRFAGSMAYAYCTKPDDARSRRKTVNIHINTHETRRAAGHVELRHDDIRRETADPAKDLTLLLNQRRRLWTLLS